MRREGNPKSVGRWWWLGLLAAGIAAPGCAERLPPRPIPPKEAKPELPPWYPEAPWTAVKSDERVYLFGKVIFDTAAHTIRPDAEPTLRKLLTFLQNNPDISRIRLEGHTDSRSSDEYNQALSERRAIEVANWLVDEGLDHNRVLAVAFGESRPIGPNDSEEGRQENRRTAFFVAEVAGQRFRGQDPTNGGLVLTVLSKEERDALERQGQVPTATIPPFVPEGHVIKPYESEAEAARRRQNPEPEPTPAPAPAPETLDVPAPSPVPAPGPAPSSEDNLEDRL
ncbi:MAG: OmpA family protein [Myxococcota bacterium]